MAGYRMPAEWEAHEGTWLGWPPQKSDWPGKFHPIPWVYCEIVKRLAQVERVHILVNDEAAEGNARNLLKAAHAQSANVDFFECPTDRSWTRDFCPTFVRDQRGKVVLTDWQFNGWAKYPNSQTDDAVPSHIAAKLRMKATQPKLGRRRI